ncbi:cation transporter [Crocinitomix catalasitica]|nr:cation transporter [Crocinitomix catalasitica]
MKRKLLIILFLSVTGISYGQTSKTLEFTIEGMSCQACANTATQTLENVEGVISVSVDIKTKKAIVVSDGTVAPEALKEAIDSKTNFEVLFSNESLTKPLTDKERAGLEIKTILGGDKIKFSDHLSAGKITVFDFYADWCSPCKIFTPKVERLLFESKDISLVKVDVVDWKSKIAKQLTKDYEMPALPFTLIFDDKGELMGRVTGNEIDEVKRVIGAK